MNTQIVCGGAVTINSDGSPICPTGWLTQVATAPFDYSQIDPSVAMAMFVAGFSLFITPYATAWGFSLLLKMLR